MNTEYILSIVQSILPEKPSGEDFFDAFDQNILNDEKLLLNFLKSISSKHTLVLTGKFGNKISNLIDSKKCKSFSYILFNGGIRKSKEVEIIKQYGKINKKELLFIDDSFYSGKTFNGIHDFLKRFKYKLNNIFVIYDGSKEKYSNIKSLFRYFDYYN